MIKLYQFPSRKNIPNLSPFCMKLETYLRMAKLPFEIVTTMDLRKTPKGKLPYICDGDKIIADSGFIIDYLKQTYGDPLDQHLSDQQKAEALAWRRLMEEHLYWSLVYSRWIDETNWPKIKARVFARLPFLIRSFVANRVQNRVRSRLVGHGIGLHTQMEIYQLGMQDLMAIATHLGQKSFFMGEEPTSIDACLYAYLANFIESEAQSPMVAYCKSNPAFLAYCARMKERFYP